MSFCQQIWSAATPLMAAIHAHPFNRDLAAGSLDRAAFRHYMIQDSLYLQGFARALSLAAAKAPGAIEIEDFARAAQVAIVVERALHADYLGKFGIDPQGALGADHSPACQAYVDFLLARAAIGGFAELAAAILPCFWVYHEVGSGIATRSRPGNFYEAWITTYTDPEFAAAVARMKAHVDDAAARAGEHERRAMGKAFLRSTQYEYMFWDSAYRQAAWPVGTGAL